MANRMEERMSELRKNLFDNLSRNEQLSKMMERSDQMKNKIYK